MSKLFVLGRGVHRSPSVTMRQQYERREIIGNVISILGIMVLSVMTYYFVYGGR